MALTQEQINTRDGFVRVKADIKGAYRSLPINVKNEGAIGNGIADDTAAFQNALTKAATTGVNIVFVPKGQYVITNTVTIPPGVSLIGQNKIPFKAAFGMDYACIMVKTEKVSTKNCFVLSVGAAIRGFCFFWPEQLKTAAVPFQYGWAITTTATPSSGDNVVVEDIMLTNCYNGVNIDFGGQWNCRNVFGQTFNVGIRLDRVYDVARLENVHFWDFWAGGSDPAKGYAQTNGIPLQIGKVDGLQGGNIFAWGHKHTIHFTDFGNGGAWCQLKNVLADICTCPILVEKANMIQLSNVSSTNNNPSTGRAIVETGTQIDGELSIIGLNFFYAANGVLVNSTNGVVKLTNVTKRRRGIDLSDIFGYKVINTSTARVYIDEAEYNDISGFVQVGSSVVWSADIDQTSLISDFSKPHLWANDARVTAITGGSRFDLKGGIGVLSKALPVPAISELGVYVIECDLETLNPNGLDAGQFYLRLTDGGIDDIVLPSAAVNQFYVNSTRLRIPVIFRNTALQLQFVYGTNNGVCSVEITNLKLYRMDDSKVTQSLLDWLHTKQPNALNTPGPNLLARRYITTDVSLTVEPDSTAVVSVVSNTPITVTFNTAKAKRRQVIWVRRYDVNQTGAITVVVSSGQIQDTTGTFVGASMTLPATGTKAVGFVFDGNNTHCILTA